MSTDRKVIAVVGDQGFTHYPLMQATLKTLLRQMEVNPDSVVIANSNTRGAESHAAAFAREHLKQAPWIVPIPWEDLTEPCQLSTKVVDGVEKSYNRLAVVKRDLLLLDDPDLYAVVYFHVYDPLKPLKPGCKMPRVVSHSPVQTFILQVGFTVKNKQRIATFLTDDQPFPAPIVPTEDLKSQYRHQRRDWSKLKDRSALISP